ncbi:bifunctional DNA primase/polymerase [Streptomyces sp. NPDC006265]|uniref:bifunctional DNA primase/polymerase n=1 Tax=Streptomyces sp. NPDC006265 TaxID=3156740 RepID=UPI0033BA8571
MTSEKTNAPAATGANEGDQLTAGSSDTVAQGRATGNYGLVTPLDGALWLIRHGFPVFPCDHPRTPRCTGLHKTCDGSRGKHPAVAFTRAWTLDERRVHETFSRGLRNPAVAVGACQGPYRTRLVVMDSDRPGAIEDVASAHGERWPATMRVLTAKGYHDYLWVPATLKLGNGLGALQGQFGGDVRAGNAYVIGPGARHASGFRYALEDPERPPSSAPAWLLDALVTKPQFAARRARWRDASHPASGNVRGLVAFVLDSAPGTRNNRLFWAACRAAEDARDGRADAQDALLAAALQAGLDEREARTTIRSAYNRMGATA